ncbi:preprotein translocase subunit SecG [Pseudahrensia aquimaris]|uniref:Protein-export membrane protein SecG n=1 Tax=Pseudahrensia aquimaris TaxID=744461 RepID=A0ABW3FGA2_9HYPH
MSEVFDTILIVVHIMLVLTLIVLVLLQKSEGGALGIGGGGGGGGGGFMSARGAANALTKTTSIVAAAFFATSILLGVSANQGAGTNSIIDRAEQNQSTGVPTEGGDQPAGGGNLLEGLQREGQGNAPSTGVPTGN